MEIRATCKYDLNSVKALNHLSMFKKAEPEKQITFLSVVFAILSAIILLETIIFGMDPVLFILFGINVILDSFIYFCYFFLPKIQYNSLAKMKNGENKYIFGDNTLKIFLISEKYCGEAEIEYSFFVKVYETTKYLFLFQTKNQVFIVDKSTIEDGNVESIRNKLSSFLKDKYIICKY